MARTPNAAEGKSLTMTLSRQSLEALEKIAARGIYGRNAAEVAARFVDRALQDLIEFPPITLRPGQED
jgi:hypothetical protein